MADELYARFRSARLVTVLKVEVNEGEGVTGDPVRRVAYFLTPDGTKVIGKLGEELERKFAGGGDELWPIGSEL